MFASVKIQNNQSERIKYVISFLVKKLQCFTYEFLQNHTSESESGKTENLKVFVQSL